MKVTYLQHYIEDRIGLVVPYYDLEIGEVGKLNNMYFKRMPDGSTWMSLNGGGSYGPWVSSKGIESANKWREYTSLMVEIIE